MTKDNAPQVKYLTPEGGLPTGNWPKHMLVAWVPASTLTHLEEENARLRELVKVSFIEGWQKSCGVYPCEDEDWQESDAFAALSASEGEG